MTPLVLLRHGQSVWNHERRFTGWADVGLSAKGHTEAETAGKFLKEAGYAFDICFTSVLQRAQKTLKIVLETLDQSQLPIHTSWCLNERHYGALQGLSRQETAQQYSPEQVSVWQQQFDVRPPALEADDEHFPGNDPRYAQLPVADLPYTESIKDVRGRVLPHWHEMIVPHIAAGKRVLIVAHGNSLRSLTTYLDGVLEEEIAAIKRPLTGEPLIYELDDSGKPVRHFYLRRTPKLQRWAKSTLQSVVKSTLVDSILKKSAK
jgi:2,3-bisphosphoglycerate-dependent phosphoglycerate mutase